MMQVTVMSQKKDSDSECKPDLTNCEDCHWLHKEDDELSLYCDI